MQLWCALRYQWKRLCVCTAGISFGGQTWEGLREKSKMRPFFYVMLKKPNEARGSDRAEWTSLDSNSTWCRSSTLKKSPPNIPVPGGMVTWPVALYLVAVAGESARQAEWAWGDGVSVWSYLTWSLTTWVWSPKPTQENWLPQMVYGTWAPQLLTKDSYNLT